MIGGVSHQQTRAEPFGLTAGILIKAFLDNQGGAGDPSGGDTRFGRSLTTHEG